MLLYMLIFKYIITEAPSYDSTNQVCTKNGLTWVCPGWQCDIITVDYFATGSSYSGPFFILKPGIPYDLPDEEYHMDNFTISPYTCGNSASTVVVQAQPFPVDWNHVRDTESFGNWDENGNWIWNTGGNVIQSSAILAYSMVKPYWWIVTKNPSIFQPCSTSAWNCTDNRWFVGLAWCDVNVLQSCEIIDDSVHNITVTFYDNGTLALSTQISSDNYNTSDLIDYSSQFDSYCGEFVQWVKSDESDDVTHIYNAVYRSIQTKCAQFCLQHFNGGCSQELSACSSSCQDVFS